MNALLMSLMPSSAGLFLRWVWSRHGDIVDGVAVLGAVMSKQPRLPPDRENCMSTAHHTTHHMSEAYVIVRYIKHIYVLTRSIQSWDLPVPPVGPFLRAPPTGIPQKQLYKQGPNAPNTYRFISINDTRIDNSEYILCKPWESVQRMTRLHCFRLTPQSHKRYSLQTGPPNGWLRGLLRQMHGRDLRHDMG